MTAQDGTATLSLTPPVYDGRPHDTAALEGCYETALDAALSSGCGSVTIPTLGAWGGWPPQFAVPVALVAVERWRKAHPDAALDVTLSAPDQRTYELYEEFAVTGKEMPATENVVGFFHEYGPNGWFSNWYPAVFTVDGVTYLNAEQYLMHQKALCCGDTATAAKVMENPDPKTVKLLGRAITPYDDAKWAAVRQEVIYRGLLAKFGQNSGLKHQLLVTGDALIAECSPNDRIWGIGLPLDDPRCQDPAQWQGESILGRALMRVRDTLRNGEDV
jgi:ribA/ribD-fused uncharacterized protein